MLLEDSRRIKLEVRNYDLVARFGGDEFVVIATDISDKEVSGRTAENIIKCLKKPFITGGHSFELSGSVGIAFTLRTAVTPLSCFAQQMMQCTTQNMQAKGVFDLAQSFLNPFGLFKST